MFMRAKNEFKKAITGFAETLTETEGAAGLFNKTFGQADNPFMEVLFDKMAMRNFTYNFTFAPKNKDERDDVQKIIALFRFHMAPELQGQAARFLTLPSEFDIHYMYQSQTGQASENDYYNKIATCVLTDCSVDYTPGGVRSFDDGSPTIEKSIFSRFFFKYFITAGHPCPVVSSSADIMIEIDPLNLLLLIKLLTALIQHAIPPFIS